MGIENKKWILKERLHINKITFFKILLLDLHHALSCIVLLRCYIGI